jgi:2,4-dienoyl-CoA reductase-like NADH-dependent reductase (Old Yellow Enzyme family)/thioredoxin reductase
MLDLKNQFIMAPLKLGYSSGNGIVNQKHLDFFAQRSKHVGAVALEPLYIDKGLREIPAQLGIDDDNKIDGLKKLCEVIHQNGAKVIAHLNHPGRMANPKIPGNYHISSVADSCENGGAIPKMMTIDDMNNVQDLFKKASIRAKKAGIDIIEFQMGHGYLMAQFISPAVNKRTDEFGGSFDNRIKFPLTILDTLLETTDLPIVVRISGDEMIPNGIKLPEMIELVKIMEKRGIQAVHVSAGSVCSTPPWYFQHMFTAKGKTWDFAKEIKKSNNLPVIFVGRITSQADVRKLNDDYHADFIALGRALVADPDFVGKITGQISGLVRPCLSCSDGCLGGVKSGKGIGCVVNPTVGYNETPLQVVEKIDKYAVIGGGLAGMQAAITLRERGHLVDLYEKDKLGGQFNLAPLPPNKGSLQDIIEYYKSALDRNNVNIIQKEAMAGDLNEQYDGVIIASGSVPLIPNIDGLKKYFWAEYLLEENLTENKKIVIVGGGLIGVEIASKLLDKGNKVIIIEMLPEIARGMEMIERAMTLKKLKMKEVPIYTSYKVTKIEGNKVFIHGEKELVIDNVDHIVLAAGMKSYNTLENSLKEKMQNVTVIGDAKKVGKAQEAIRDAYITARNL